MKLEQSFEVSAPLERVWEALVDVQRVAPCLPGAEVTGRNEDGSYDGSFKVKIGPTSAAYTGKLRMEDIDESAHRATMDANGTDRRGQGGAKATIVSSVVAAGEGMTRVHVVTDYHITGRLARFGRGGMIEEISNRLLGEFSKNLQRMLTEGGGEAAPAPEGAPAAEGAVAAEGAPAAPAGVGGAPAEGTPSAVAGVGGAIADGAPAAPAGGGGAAAESARGRNPLLAAADSVAAAAAARKAAATDAAAAELAAVVPEVDPAVEQPPFPGATPPPPAAAGSEPVQGLSLVGSALVSQVRKHPAPVAGLLVALLVVLRLIRR